MPCPDLPLHSTPPLLHKVVMGMEHWVNPRKTNSLCLRLLGLRDHLEML